MDLEVAPLRIGIGFGAGQPIERLGEVGEVDQGLELCTCEAGGKMAGFRASDGKLLWDIKTGIDSTLAGNYSSRPVIIDRTVYLEPFAYDLATGDKLDYRMDRSYNCGIVTGSRNLLVFRSAVVGYVDLTKPGSEVCNFGGIRPGCWINTLPVGGVVLMPDATARCNCSYLMKASIALQSLK